MAIKSQMPLSALVQGFIFSLQAAGKAPSTVHYYQGNLRRFLWYGRQQGWPDDAQAIDSWKIREFLAYAGSARNRWGVTGNGIDQSTVSNYAQGFKVKAHLVGLLAAGKEFSVMEEVNSLRSLAVELGRNKMTVEGAKEGLHIMRLFQQLGVSPDEHQDLIRLCRKVKDGGFVDAALRLSQLEENAGMTHDQVVSRFEDLAPRVGSLEQRKTELEAQISESMQSIAARRRELSSVRKEVEQAKKSLEKEKSRLEGELKRRMAEFDVATKEIAEVSKLKSDLRGVGLGLVTITKFAEEFSTKGGKFDGARLREAIEKYGSLHRALAIMESQRQSLEAEIADLGGQQLAAVNEKKKLSAQITGLEHNVREGTEVLDYLNTMIERDRRQYDLFEAFMAMVLTSPSSGDKSIGDLISSFQEVVLSGWFTAKSAEDLRNAFIRVVLGDYLYCFHCDKCDAKFIVNREPYDYSNYQCPACHSSLWVKEDDSFLVEMVSPGKPEEVSRAQELQKEADRLKPLEVFLDIPCAICGEPMPNDKWVREDIVKIFKEVPKAHPACWKTPIGGLIWLREYAKSLGDVFGQSEGSKLGSLPNNHFILLLR